MVVPLQHDKIPIPVLCSENLFRTEGPLWLAKNSSQNSFVENSCQLKGFWFINQTVDRKRAGNSLEWIVWSNPQTFHIIWTVPVCTQAPFFCLGLQQWLHACNRDKLGLLPWSHLPARSVPLKPVQPQRTRPNVSGKWEDIYISIYTAISSSAASLLIAYSYRKGKLMK